MRTLSRRLEPATSLVFMLGISLAPSSPSAAQGVCQGFDGKHILKQLGGPRAFAPGGDYKRTRAQLQEFFAANPESIRAAVASGGLGKGVSDGVLERNVSDALLEAVRQNTDITERPMRDGEGLEWMAYRLDGQVKTISNVCVDLPGYAPAFVIPVSIPAAAGTATPDCSIDVTPELQPGGPGTLRVRTAPGARVTMEGPGGTRTVIEGGASSWTGPWEDPYRAHYAFTVTNEAATTQMVTTYTFLVPRECLNLSYVDKVEKPRPGIPATCTDRRIVPVPPPSTCDKLVLDKTEAHVGDVVSYQVTGKWVNLELEVQLDGVKLPDIHLTGVSGTFVVTRPGTYTVVATTTNELGEKTSASACQQTVHVVPARWIVRAFGALLFPHGETSGSVNPGSCPCAARTTDGYDDDFGEAFGVGVSVERLLNERIGVEARGLYGRLHDEFRIEANGIGIAQRESVNYWDFSLGVNFHLTPKSKVDWYVGPFVGYSKVDGFTSLVVGRSLEYDVDGELSWGAQMGLDWHFGDGPWSLHGGARYTWYDPDVTLRYINPTGAVLERRDSIGVHPITLELGVAYHF